jgi:hypothetical protein
LSTPLLPVVDAIPSCKDRTAHRGEKRPRAEPTLATHLDGDAFVGLPARAQRAAPATPRGELAKVQGVRVSGESAVAGEKAGKGKPLGIAEHGLWDDNGS